MWLRLNNRLIPIPNDGVTYEVETDEPVVHVYTCKSLTQLEEDLDYYDYSTPK